MKFYKYFTSCSETLKKTLLPNTISLRFTQPNCLNDPFEILPAFRSRIYNSHKTEYPEMKGKLDNSFYAKIDTFVHRERHNRTINSNLGILSLTKNKNSRLMWSHYSDDHKGILIQFDIPNTNNLIKKVRYCSKRPIDQGIEKINSYSYIKDKIWSYEKEWRIIGELSDLDNVGNEVYVRKCPTIIVKKITLGYLCSEDTKQFVKQWVKHSAPHVELYKADLSSISYKLIYKPIPI